MVRHDQVRPGRASRDRDHRRRSATGTFRRRSYAPGTRGYRKPGRRPSPPRSQFNEPGRFTAFIGYEWTSNTGGNNLHRNVIFRDNGARPARWSRSLRSNRWAATIPSICGSGWSIREENRRQRARHRAQRQPQQRPDVSRVEAFGKKLDREYAETRASGSDSTRPRNQGYGRVPSFLSPNDEFANFEIWDKGNLDGSAAKKKKCSNSSTRARR